ncbi:hypothetical protein GF406_12090 [candidate division KSB1 bacterium]|nr:hypothetical protein [candidate division KSB1 bacterium]
MHEIDELRRDKRVDQKSLEARIATMNSLAGEQKKDIEAELRAGYHFLKLVNLQKIEFVEAPDIILTDQNGCQEGVEVKRIRPKPEDDKDERKFKRGNGITRFGKPRSDYNTWASQVEKVIEEKNGNKYSTNQLSLFLVSDSPYQIERGEIIQGIECAHSDLNGLIFSVIFFVTVWKSHSGIHYKFIDSARFSRVLAKELGMNDYYKAC